MNTRYKVILVQNGCQRKVVSCPSYEDAIKFKKEWKLSNPNDQLVIQPENSWEYPNG